VNPRHSFSSSSAKAIVVRSAEITSLRLADIAFDSKMLRLIVEAEGAIIVFNTALPSLRLHLPHAVGKEKAAILARAPIERQPSNLNEILSLAR
jgi:hypothetical protein